MAVIFPPQKLAKISLLTSDLTQESCAERYGGKQTTEEKEPKQIQIDDEDVNFQHGELTVSNAASFIPQKEIGVKAFGLTQEAVQHVQQCQDNLPGHESYLYYVRELIEDNLDNYTEIPDFDKVTEMLARPFLFTNDKAHEVSTWLSKIYLIEHESMSYWTKQYVEFWNDALHLSLSFPHKEKLTGQWFTVPESQKGEGQLVYIANVPVKESHFCSQDNKFDHRNTTSPYKKGFWYHGTDHGSAESIRIKGISLKEGGGKKDFAHNDGFYLTSDFEQAKKWSFNKFSPAVLIFECKFNEEEFLDLTTSKEKWDEIVTYCRGGEKGKPPDGFKAAASIYGRMSGDGTEKIEGKPSLSACKNPQLCIKSAKLAETISQNLKGIYYFCKKDIK
ncbi:uncharacterized protein LOC130630657 [Hydractinia symbiolongicarpus]|uniref:uncharacterized protein LOC130630657 n=1 Tax=Hydractinia symbiolongicarpus TaxID=13093 RepID=UPI00254CFF68|nr:uncharacterized protein LOC130630657 [Hydractinia symbiolongicarpus]XP_057300216.1 uncharacterized protein LOC130630657 [Hydractinia symbiolongicarpus]